MNKAFFAGLVIGFLLGYLWKQERVQSSLTFPTNNTSDPWSDWWSYGPLA